MGYIPIIALDSEGHVAEWISLLCEDEIRRCDHCDQNLFQYWTPLTGEVMNLCEDCFVRWNRK